MTQIRVTGSPVAMQRTEGKTVKLVTFIPLKIKKRGGRRVIVRPDSMAPTDTLKPIVQHDTPMQVALSKAFHWQRLLEQGLAKSGTEIAQREGLHHSMVNEMLRLTLLEPAIIQSILAGKQPRCMSLLWFQRNPLPVDWLAQRELVARFDA